MTPLSVELIRAASTALDSYSDFRVAATALRDRRTGDQSTISAYLHDVTNRRDLAAAIAADSYWHSNGFAKLNLVRSTEPDLRLRLHVWPEPKFPRQCVPPYEQIHNHRWPFSSVILCGAIMIREYQVVDIVADPEATWYSRFSYEAADDMSTCRLRPNGKAAIADRPNATYGPRDVHHCDTATLHTVAARERAFTATLVLQGPAEADAADVYQRTDRAALEDTGMGLTTDEVVDLVAATLATMGESGWR